MTSLMDMGRLSAPPTPTFGDNIHQHYAFGSPNPPIHPIHQASASLATPVPSSIDIRLHQVLARLPHIKIISRLVRRWLQVCISCPVPRPLLLDLLVAVESTAHRCNPSDGNAQVADAALSQLAEDIQNANSRPLVVPRGLQLAEFFQLLTGRNLRAESIGLVLSVAGNAALGLLESDVVFSSTGMNQDVLDRKAFAGEMLSASDAAIAFAKEQCHDLNDVLLWLRYESFVLTRNCCGYESYRTWARSGRLINDLFAMDIHRDPERSQASDTPWFLREIQTRLFACTYEADKSLSGVLGKPPRLPRQYCNRRLPLKISDENVLTAAFTSDDSIVNTPHLGSFICQESFPSDWLRIRFLFATLKEVVLSVRLGISGQSSESLIRRTSSRIQAAWEALPTYLCYNLVCTQNLTFSSPYLYLARLLLYLDYLDLQFSTQQALCYTSRKDNGGNTKLLKLGLTLVTTTTNASRVFCRHFGASTDTALMLCLYGLPSALILADALANTTEGGQDMSTANISDMLPLSWLELHRQLSVLSAELEAIADSTDSNYGLYSKQKETLTRQLDRALHARLDMSPSKLSQLGETSTAPLSDIDKLIAEMAEDETFADVSIGDLESSAGPWTLDDIFNDCIWNVSE
ncbi:hypothetical protein N7527_010910 [Penicillium freii]|uniref:Transcription factor domain-containing protein n=1 Tax=Penicillium freii TaxID=48697 RepID=A0A101M7J0_PENFR|nr:hypothetical protein N7527_010910 [Penicillium freii]KUM55471.1 hypothetical protein ACN42_g11800 [Penicillium freii]